MRIRNRGNRVRMRPYRPKPELEDGERIAVAMGHDDRGGCACGRGLDEHGRCYSADSVLPCEYSKRKDGKA